MNQNLEFYSFIIPTLNRPIFLDRCLESIFNQTLQNFEIIIVDDGSTADIVKDLKLLDHKKIRCFHQSNKGRSLARNFGLEKALGNFVVFQDDDDYFFPTFLQEISQIINNPEYDDEIIKTLAFWKKNDQLIIEPPLFDNERPYKSQAEVVFLHSMSCGQCCIPKKLLSSHKFDESLNYAEDLLFFTLLALDGAKFSEIKSALVVFDDHDGRSVNKISRKDITKIEKAQNQALTSIAKHQNFANSISKKAQIERLSANYSLLFRKSSYRYPMLSFWNISKVIMHKIKLQFLGK